MLKLMEVEQTANTRQVNGTHYKDMDVQPWDVIGDWPSLGPKQCAESIREMIGEIK